MELWGWLIGYVVLFALLHLLLYYVYVRRGDGGGRPRPSFADGNGTTGYSSRPEGYSGAGPADDRGDPDSGSEPALEIDGATVRCPHCGSPNEADQTFSYCWNCISTLRQ